MIRKIHTYQNKIALYNNRFIEYSSYVLPSDGSMFEYFKFNDTLGGELGTAVSSVSGNPVSYDTGVNINDTNNKSLVLENLYSDKTGGRLYSFKLANIWNLHTDWTITAWVKVDEVSSNVTSGEYGIVVFGASSAYMSYSSPLIHMGISGNNNNPSFIPRLYFRGINYGDTPAFTLDTYDASLYDGNWHFLVVRRDEALESFDMMIDDVSVFTTHYEPFDYVGQVAWCSIGTSYPLDLSPKDCSAFVYLDNLRIYNKYVDYDELLSIRDNYL